MTTRRGKSTRAKPAKIEASTAAIERLREIAERKLPEITALIERSQLVRDWLECAGSIQHCWRQLGLTDRRPGDRLGHASDEPKRYGCASLQQV